MVQRKFCRVPEEESIASSMGVGGPPEGEFHGGAWRWTLETVGAA